MTTGYPVSGGLTIDDIYERLHISSEPVSLTLNRWEVHLLMDQLLAGVNLLSNGSQHNRHTCRRLVARIASQIMGYEIGFPDPYGDRGPRLRDLETSRKPPRRDPGTQPQRRWWEIWP